MRCSGYIHSAPQEGRACISHHVGMCWSQGPWCRVWCEVWMVLVVCIKLDGVRWAGSSAYTACSTRFDKVFRVCADITQPPHWGRCVMPTTSIIHTSDCIACIICIIYTIHAGAHKKGKIYIIYIIYHIYLCHYVMCPNCLPLTVTWQGCDCPRAPPTPHPPCPPLGRTHAADTEANIDNTHMWYTGTLFVTC